jgi:LDH2 family malate/lactate/ureidoglycolate dehydrogenase
LSSDSDVSVYPADVLVAVTARVLAGLGAPADLAGLVAESLVLSNLVGHDSHGFIRLVEYSGWVEAGQLDPGARPSVAWSKGGTTLIDGHWGWGQAAAALGVGHAIEGARQHGTATVVLSRSHHVGRLGEWVDIVAAAGMMGLAFCNTGGAAVAPHGGIGRVLGTNPFAWSMPGPDDMNLVLDFSTAMIAAGKVVLAAMSGREIPAGALLDRAGRPSTRAADLADGGALLPFGGHKGSGLSMLIEVAAGLLAGTMPAAISESGYGNGTVFIVVDLGRFIAPDTVAAVSRQFASVVHASAPAGAGPVLLPGELEARTRAERGMQGIGVAAGVRHEVAQLAGKLGVDLPEFG